VTPLEVKYSAMKKPEVQRAYRGFLERYHPKRGYIVNRSLSGEVIVGETRVRCLPYWELMFDEAFSISGAG